MAKFEKLGRQDHALYQEGVALYLGGHNERLRTFLTRADLSSQEKQLIESRQLLRSGQILPARKLLEGISSVTSTFLEADRQFLLANAAFQNGAFEEAVEFNLEALHFYRELNDRRGNFLCHYNLSADYNRLGLNRLSYRHLKIAQNLSEGASEEILILRAIACHQSNQCNYAEAVQTIQTALLRSENQGPADALLTQNIAADILFRAGLTVEALDLLRKIRRNRMNREKARSEFEFRAISKVLLKKEKLGKMPPVVGQCPEHSLKWKILSCLASGEMQEARRYWNGLRKLCPEEYSQEFECKNPSLRKGVFGTALESLRKQTETQDLPADNYSQNLERILRNSPYPLRKEELIEAVWLTRYHPSLDQRFYRMISRLKRRQNLNILCVDRAYRLDGYRNTPNHN